MFKKRNLKGTNFAQDMGALGTSQARPRTEDKEEDNMEPVVQKKVKTTYGAKYSTKEITEEYGKMADEYTDELKFKARGDLITKDAGNAFAHREIDTDEAHDARAIKLKQIQRSKDIKAGKVDTKLYAGESGYAIYAEKSENDISKSKYTGTLGPIRAPSNIRATVRFDYNPSLCKDWHDTGYCGFGDSCIYIHDRGDYKSGWELEKEWEKEQAEKAKKFSVTSGGYVAEGDEEEPEEEEGPPRKCQICEEEFKSPVQTSCQHYFCEKCIFDEYRKTKKCPVCSKTLNGNFNVAHDVISRNKAEEKEGKKGNTQGKKKGKVVFGQNGVDTKGEDDNKGEVGEGLEGVDFGGSEEEVSEEEEEEKKPSKDYDLGKLADEFKAGQRKPGKFDIQSDWLYQ